MNKIGLGVYGYNPLKVPMVEILDNYNLAIYYRTIANCIEKEKSIWACDFRNRECAKCIFYKNDCRDATERNLEQWFNLFHECVSTWLHKPDVDKNLIAEMILKK